MEEIDFDEFKERLMSMGKVARKIKKDLDKLVVVEASYLDICEVIEDEIMNAGFLPAFPVNISVNEIAAHDTAAYNDDRVIEEGDLVKIDFGIVDDMGFIVDTARSLSMGDGDSRLIETAEKALQNAIKLIKDSVDIGKVSEEIEKTIIEDGLKPISNLTGHVIEPYNLHSGISIPNVKTHEGINLQFGDVVAIEPFVTYKGGGFVKDINRTEIYALHDIVMPRLRFSRKLLEIVVEKYKTLPFAERWIYKVFQSPLKVRAALKELLKIHALKAYPVLVEANNQKVAQAESTVLVDEDRAIVVC